MNTAILLCAAILAADKPTQVQAKVLDGNVPRNEQMADIDLWIKQAAAKAGSPLVLPHTGWISLDGDDQRLYTSKHGGFIIDCKATQRHGKYKVAINACAGLPLDKTIVLKPGECRVINLTGNPAPNNVFVALQAPASEQTKKRAEAMKANAKSFRLELNYNGDQDKPFYCLIVSVPEIDQLARDPFCPIVQIQEDEAIRIIDHLARDGFLDRSVDPRTNKTVPVRSLPGYTMKVVAGDDELIEDLGWGLPMIERIDCLRAALSNAGKKDMDLLLGRLSGWRAQWELEQPALDANSGSDVRFMTQNDTTIIDITSESGIDQATIMRRSDNWPKSIAVRLHLSGLESFQAGSGNVDVEWSVASTRDHATRASLVSGKRVAAIEKDSPYFTEVRIVGGNEKIPLKEGYFEVPLPAKLLEGNPQGITLQWIDFYRN